MKPRKSPSPYTVSRVKRPLENRYPRAVGDKQCSWPRTGRTALFRFAPHHGITLVSTAARGADGMGAFHIVHRHVGKPQPRILPSQDPGRAWFLLRRNRFHTVYPVLVIQVDMWSVLRRRSEPCDQPERADGRRLAVQQIDRLTVLDALLQCRIFVASTT